MPLPKGIEFSTSRLPQPKLEPCAQPDCTYTLRIIASVVKKPWLENRAQTSGSRINTFWNTSPLPLALVTPAEV